MNGSEGGKDPSDATLGACRRCVRDCYASPVESSFVGYIPFGYTYSVSADMYDALDNYEIEGGFRNQRVTLGRNDSEIYVYVPKRASDRGDYDDLELGGSERKCLADYMTKCGIDAVIEYTDHTGVSSSLLDLP